MLSSGTGANELRLAHFIEWSLTAEGPLSMPVND